MPAIQDTTDTTAAATPRVYMTQRTDPTRGRLFSVIAHGMPAIADTTDRPAALAEAMRVAGGAFGVYDCDRRAFLTAGVSGDPGDAVGDPGPFGDPANRRPLRLAWYAGDLCVVTESTMFYEPATLATYFPAFPMRRGDFDAMGLASLEIFPNGSGEYAYRTEYGRPGVFRLRDGGRTMAVLAERRDVPRPKVGKATELRWYSGRWEKRTKTKGWHVA